MRTAVVLGTVLAAAGCAGEVTGVVVPGGPDDDPGAPASVAFVAPAPGSVHVRNVVGELGHLVAPVAVELSADGPVAAIALYAGDQPLGELAAGAALELTAELRADGAIELRAVAADADGNPVAEAAIDVVVEAPATADCYEWLDLYGLQWEAGPSREGAPDPVTVTTPINGITHRYVSNEGPRDTFFMDCTLAVSLARAAPFLHERGVWELVDIGVYNYRCIGGGEPPDCPNGISEHAYARAIDIAGVTADDGTFYSVNDDWVIDPDTEETCEAATEGAKDAFLHELICAMKDDGVWNIVLTPNYNDAHRNHFHVDLKPGSDFIEREATPLLARPASAFDTH